MPQPRSASRYAAPVRWLHWLTAAVLIAAFGLGIAFLLLPRNAAGLATLLTLHKSLGVTALALALLRIVLRLATRFPPYEPPIGRFAYFVARTAHVLLYAGMIALPVSGYVHAMAGGHAFSWFGLFPVPNLVPLDPQLDAGAGQAHLAWAVILGALSIIHTAAAVWHKIVRDGVYERMEPGGVEA